MIPKQLRTVLHSEIDPAFQKRSSLIFEEVAKLRPRRVLDAGCGRGFYSKALTFFPFIRAIHGLDLNPEYVATASRHNFDKRLKLRVGSVYRLPYPSNYFDVIICSEVLEHLDSDLKGLREIARVLKKGGRILITVPRLEFPFLWDPLNWLLTSIFHTHVPRHIWWLAGIWADHERLYTEKTLVSLFGKLNLSVVLIKPVVRGSIPFAHFLLYGIGKNIVERLGASQFDRFSFEKKPLSQFLAKMFLIPTILDTKARLKKSSVNYFTVVTK